MSAVAIAQHPCLSVVMLSVFCETRQRLLLAEFSGLLTLADLQRLAVIARHFVEDKGTVPTITNLSAVTAIDVPSNAIAVMGRAAPIMGEQWRVYVAPTSEAFGMGRLYATYQSMAGFKPPKLVRSL